MGLERSTQDLCVAVELLALHALPYVVIFRYKVSRPSRLRVIKPIEHEWKEVQLSLEIYCWVHSTRAEYADTSSSFPQPRVWYVLSIQTCVGAVRVVRVVIDHVW